MSSKRPLFSFDLIEFWVSSGNPWPFSCSATSSKVTFGRRPAQDAILRSIELLGTVVAPKVRAELAKRKVSA
jgi:hypothetical protein